jgi:tRNA(fMet)-specific endonuclease VapC
MKYLLDTCAISDFVKGYPLTLRKIKSMSPQLLYVSTISIMEIEYGLQLNPKRAQKIFPALQAFLSTIKILPFGEADAKAAGTIRVALRRQGSPIGFYDVLIAGSAISGGMILVTSNTDEFSRVDGLVLENWRLQEGVRHGG